MSFTSTRNGKERDGAWIKVKNRKLVMKIRYKYLYFFFFLCDRKKSITLQIAIIIISTKCRRLGSHQGPIIHFPPFVLISASQFLFISRSNSSFRMKMEKLFEKKKKQSLKAFFRLMFPLSTWKFIMMILLFFSHVFVNGYFCTFPLDIKIISCDFSLHPKTFLYVNNGESSTCWSLNIPAVVYIKPVKFIYEFVACFLSWWEFFRIKQHSLIIFLLLDVSI